MGDAVGAAEGGSDRVAASGRARRPVSPISVLAVLVIAGATLAGFFVFNGSAEDQEKTLLRSDAQQASLAVTSTFSAVGPYLDSLATAAVLSGGSPTVFADRAKALSQGNTSSLVLAHRQGSAYVVDSAVGPGFAAGQTLSQAMAATLDRAGATVTPGPVVFNGKTSTSFFAVGPPLTPAGSVVFLSFAVRPFLASPVTSSEPFSLLRVALYGAPVASRGSLLVATARPGDLPLTGSTVTAHPTVGTARWTLVAQARVSLVGSFARQAPYIILALGLFLALVVAATVEVLDRRSRYAGQMAEKGTADLRATLAELRDAQDAIVRSERLTALGEMASVVGHELRNPLAAVMNALFLLRRHLGDPADAGYEKHLAMAERETAKAASLAEDLTAFVRPREPHKEQVALSEVVHEVMEAAPPPDHVVLDVDVEPISVFADRHQLAEVLTNLVTNAYQAVYGGGSVRVSSRRTGSSAELAVEDSGPGIDAALADRVFEPFFTTRHDGTGLGLAIVQRLVEAHGGWVAFERPLDDRGTRVVVHLPIESADDPVEVLS
jgi:signal transduction histidine kinase